MIRLFIISGTSGSGKSVAIRALEDAGFNCIDNLPVYLLENFIQSLDPQRDNQIAIAIDGRQGSAVQDLQAIITRFKTLYEVTVIFLDASTTTIVNRFSETRRRHPLSFTGNATSENSLIESIYIERELLSSLSSIGHHIDTTNLSTNTLRTWIKELIQKNCDGLTLLFESFGYKYGVPQDVDLVFDARCIPNPHYEQTLRNLTGNDLSVQEFLHKHPIFTDLKNDIQQFLQKWLPKYQSDGRSYLTIGIGCTGGQHRSVAMVNELHADYQHNPHPMFQNITLIKRHREISLS